VVLDVTKLPKSDPDTWALLATGRTKGVFQLEGHLGRKWCRELRPDSIDDIGALVALLRPGCLRSVSTDLQGKDIDNANEVAELALLTGVEKDVSDIDKWVEELENNPDDLDKLKKKVVKACTKNMPQRYCDRKHGLEKITYYHKDLEPILKSTQGCLVFQEQAMQIAQQLAGFNLQEADILRKAMGKKKADIMAEVKVKFLEGCKRVGKVTEEEAKEIFSWIQESQRYSFNKCVSANTIIKRQGGRYNSTFTVEEMYKIKNDLEYAKATDHTVLRRKWNRLNGFGKGLSLCDDGRIRPNNIVDIQPSGRRLVYRITLANGSSVDVTKNHRFPMQSGALKEAGDLQVGDSLFTCGEYEPTDFAQINSFSDTTIEQLRLKDSRHDHATEGFMCGDSNPGYTNGAFTEFAANKQLLEKQCALCETVTSRLETHHIDHDRANSDISNLQMLCASCHKKAHYKSGRRKRGEKGYPSILVPIVSIECIGCQDTYDVTMDAPNHNFVVSSNIVTCNSHAISYGITTYRTAYCKAHYPVEFFCAYIRGARSKQDRHQEIKELVSDARSFGIEVWLPDFMSQEEDAYIEKNRIRFGLGDIKQVGVAALEKIARGIRDVELIIKKKLVDWTWEDYLIYFTPRISASISEALIKSGALECFCKERAVMVYEQTIWNQLTKTEQQWIQDRGYAWLNGTEEGYEWSSLREAIETCAPRKSEGGGTHTLKRTDKLHGLVELLEDPPHSLMDNPRDVAWEEEKYLGISISYRQSDASADAPDATRTCREYIEGKRGGRLVLIVEVDSVRQVKTKNGENPGQAMAIISISDKTGVIESCACFPDDWKQYANVLYAGNSLKIEGNPSRKNEGLIIKKCWEI
jgi:hypothetical protein